MGSGDADGEGTDHSSDGVGSAGDADAASDESAPGEPSGVGDDVGPIDATRLLDELEELDELSPEDRLDPLPAGGGGAVDRADAALVSTISPGEGSAPGTNGDRPDSGGEAATRPPPRRRAGSAGTAQKSASSEKIRIVSGDVELDAPWWR